MSLSEQFEADILLAGPFFAWSNQTMTMVDMAAEILAALPGLPIVHKSLFSARRLGRARRPIAKKF